MNILNKIKGKKVFYDQLTFSELKKKAKKYKSAIFLDSILNSETRLLVSNFLLILTIVFLGLTLNESGFFENVKVGEHKLSAYEMLSKYIKNDGLYVALMSISFSFFLILKGFRAYLFSTIFSTKNISFDLAKIVLQKKLFRTIDSAELFLKSSFGREVTKRLFLKDAQINDFLATKENKFIFDDDFVFTKNKTEERRIEEEINVVDYVSALYDNDYNFAKFLLKNDITKGDILKTVSWISKKHYNYKNRKRWWSRKKLASIGQIGAFLAYGQTFVLDKFASKIKDYKSIFGKTSYENYKNDVEELERILMKEDKANAFLVSDSTGLSLELLKAFDNKIKSGESYKALERSRIYILSSLRLLEVTGDAFENTFIKLLNEAVESGNVILVFEDFYPFYERAKSFNIDVLSIMESYFKTSLSFIILSNKGTYESFLQTNSYLTEYFETIITYQNSVEGLLFLLQDKIFNYERKYKIFFSFRSLEYLIKSTKNYFPNHPTSEKFLDLLEEFIVQEKSLGKKNIERKDAQIYIEKKTGIPQLVTKETKNKLLALEEELHRRVIGQDDAINAISDAIRRSRAGINDRKKPIASFLFIGSTGVGKTETAKALAQTYFGDEEKMIRFDMSEYSTNEAVAGLIGSTYTNKKGSLSKVINANPYSLILFDELEKASRPVHDLFLQILDEGQLTDAFGTKLNFRNSIIIATSNAGSDLIYKNDLDKISVKEQRKIIVDYIIDNKIFRPEFLNRFDRVVMFQKLKHDETKKIVALQLKSLEKRLKQQSFDFESSDSLEEYLANRGRTSVFGARETKRIIKDEIESLISKSILEDKISKGDKFTIVTDYDIDNNIILKIKKIG